MWLEDRVCSLAARPVLPARAPLLLPASVMSSAVPIAIGSPVSGNLTGGGADFYEIEPGSDGRLIAQTQADSGSLAASALAL